MWPLAGVCVSNHLIEHSLTLSKHTDSASNARAHGGARTHMHTAGVPCFCVLMKCHRYEVVMRADNTMGFGEISDSGILATKAQRVSWGSLVVNMPC
jgi:hypothetical protein